MRGTLNAAQVFALLVEDLNLTPVGCCMQPDLSKAMAPFIHSRYICVALAAHNPRCCILNHYMD